MLTDGSSSRSPAASKLHDKAVVLENALTGEKVSLLVTEEHQELLQKDPNYAKAIMDSVRNHIDKGVYSLVSTSDENNINQHEPRQDQVTHATHSAADLSNPSSLQKSATTSTDDESRHFWSPAATMRLIHAYRENAWKFNELPTQKKEVWKAIAEAVNAEGGDTHQQTWQTCSKKWSNMSRTYKNIHSSIKSKASGRNRCYWEYYDIFHRMHSDKEYGLSKKYSEEDTQIAASPAADETSDHNEDSLTAGEGDNTPVVLQSYSLSPFAADKAQLQPVSDALAKVARKSAKKRKITYSDDNQLEILDVPGNASEDDKIWKKEVTDLLKQCLDAQNRGNTIMERIATSMEKHFLREEMKAHLQQNTEAQNKRTAVLEKLMACVEKFTENE